MATTQTDKVTVYTFNVYVTVPMDDDNDGTGPYPTVSAKDVEKSLMQCVRKMDGYVDCELMDTEVKQS